MNASAVRGYGFRLALRHLFLGWSRPRLSVREAPLSELGRIALFAASAGLLLSLDPAVRSALLDYVEEVRQSSEVGLFFLGAAILAAALTLLIIALYMIECTVLHAALRICSPGSRSFASTRTLVAIGGWIVTLPAVAAYLLGGLLIGGPSDTLNSSGFPAWFAWAVTLPWAVLCVSEAAGISLLRSAAVCFVALAGCTIAYKGLDIGLDRLNEVLLSFVPSKIFA